MSVTLNFGAHEKSEIKKVMAGFDGLETKTDFEEMRWKARNCVVTLYSSGKLVIQGLQCKKVKEFILSELGLPRELQLGIDETGRGERSGPLVIAGVLGDKNKLRELRDSKKTANIGQKREIASKNALAIATVEFSPEFIDHSRKKGVTVDELQAKAARAINLALNPKSEWPVLVDGKALKGCNGFKFVVKGDDIEPVIGAASVIAKNARENSANKEKRQTWKNK